jgi:hypothetical protein
LVTLTLLLAAMCSVVKKILSITAVLWGMFAGLSSIVLPILFGEVFTWAMKWVSGAPQPGYGYPLPTRWSILFLTPAFLAAVLILSASFAPLRISLLACGVAFLVAAEGACLARFTHTFRFETFFCFDLSPTITFPLGLAFSTLLPLLAQPAQPRRVRQHFEQLRLRFIGLKFNV